MCLPYDISFLNQIVCAKDVSEFSVLIDSALSSELYTLVKTLPKSSPYIRNFARREKEIRENLKLSYEKVCILVSLALISKFASHITDHAHL